MNYTPFKFVVAIAITSLSLSIVAQNVAYVTPTGAGTQTGDSWANATPNLWNAMNSATPGDEVWVAAGTYTPTDCGGTCTETDRLSSFPLKSGVTVVGGFLGTETLRVEANPSNTTTLSGDIGTAGSTGDNSYAVVVCDNCDVNAGLENFIISDGYADRAAASGPNEIGRAGAGMYLAGQNGVANPVLTNCTFQNNFAIGRGGALYGNGSPGESSPIFRNCSFNNNSSNAEGGAVAFNGTNGTVNPKFFDCRFISNATVFSGSVGQAGGAMFVSTQNGSAVVTTERCLFQSNTAEPNVNGAANANQSGTGGAIYLTTASSGTSILNASNTIFDQNQAFSAGAVYMLGAAVNFENVTVTQNVASGNGGSGGGLYLNSSTANISNSIFFGNTVPLNPFGGKDIRFVNGTANTSYTLVEAASETELFNRASTSNTDVLNAGSGMIYGSDPELSSTNGYPEIGMATSPAIDAGDNANTEAKDFLNLPRILNGTVDLGAVESNFVPLPVELISFSAAAKGAGISIVWESASEIDLSGYRLERQRVDGSFASIVFVPAMELGKYSYTDIAVLAGQDYYYRLTSVDHDGQTYESDIVVASLQAQPLKKLVTNLYPNPSTGILKLTISPEASDRVVYAAIIDQTGKRVRFWPVTSVGSHELNLQGLPKGEYILSLKSGDYAETNRFVIQ